ncbi:hypothetical protein EDD99_5644 [Streptomyces sp. 846.5]|nr:zinc ribbon domain-containing protein [Streptomyces sp. 846.5]TDT97499.1 hypothetical protein EDD99_5644 [Streptomyces sp. 846.5]
MRTCSRCGRPLAPDAVRFCTSCGQPIEPNGRVDQVEPVERIEPGGPAQEPPPAAADRRSRYDWRVFAAIAAVIAVAAVTAILLTRGTGPSTVAAGSPAASSAPAPTGTTPSPAATDSPAAVGPSLTPSVGATDTSMSPQATASPTVSPSAAVTAPPDVVTAYYNALNKQDYRTAWNLGGDNLDSDYATFKAGFAQTASDHLTVTGSSGDSVSVQLAAHQSDGTILDFAGTYTVVNGKITQGSLHSTGTGVP